MLKRVLAISLMALIFGVSSPAQTATKQPQAPKTTIQPAEPSGAPVIAGGKTLFTVRESV